MGIKNIRKILYIVTAILVIGLCIIGVLRQDRPTIGDKLINGVPLYFFVIFALVGLINLEHSLSGIVYRAIHCRYVSEGVCVGAIKKYHPGKGSWNGYYTYAPVYEIEYESAIIRIQSSSYVSELPKIGAVDILHTDVRRADDLYINHILEGLVSPMIVGVIFSLPAMAILILAAIAN